MDLNLLKAFDALMREQNVTRAGDKIGLTQPAMSQALARLRLEFNDDLFVRTPRGMEPTSKAHSLYVEISTALEHIQAAITKSEIFSPDVSTRTFVAGVTEYAEIAIVEGMLKRCLKSAPKVDLRFVPTSKSNFVAQLEAQDIDIAIGHFKDFPQHLLSHPLYEERLVVIAQKDHPQLREKSRLTLAEYISLTHILVSPTGEKRGAIDKDLARRSLQRRIGLVIGSFLALPLALENSHYIATVPEAIAKQLTLRADIQLIELPFPHVMEVDIVWHKREASDVAHAWFRSRLLETVELA